MTESTALAAHRPESLTVAVVSDLHVYHPDGVTDPPSHISITTPEDQPQLHPLAGLLRLIEQKDLRADLLLSCGDMADKAHPEALNYAWRWLHRIKTELGADQLIATAGNHDMDSRHKYNDHDAKGVLQSLTPPFPLADPEMNDKYWARNYAIVEHDAYRVVALNSSAYHGVKEEFVHGRVAGRTVRRLQNELDSLHPAPVNLLVCHHHPHRFGDIDPTDYSEMDGAHYLMEVLGSGNYGHWMIVHGHKHYPRLQYGAGSSSAPIIFSAGSLAANLYLELQTKARNQFYLITFPYQAFRGLGLPIAGTFLTWEWISAAGWQLAQAASTLPSWGGFGYREAGEMAADRLDSYVPRGVGSYVEWDQVLTDMPHLRYLIPDDLNALRRNLPKYSLRMLSDDDGQIRQVGRSKS